MADGLLTRLFGADPPGTQEPEAARTDTAAQPVADGVTPLAEHGVIGDLRSAALVARDGTIDFFCAGAFDCPTIFASLLDPEGGCFMIRPAIDGHRTMQMYLPDTNVLLTRFLSDAGIAEVTDFMPLPGYGGPQRIVRHIRVIRGALDFDVLCAPRPGYATARCTASAQGQSATFARTETGLGTMPELRLRATFPLSVDDGDVRARVHLQAGGQAAIALEVSPDLPPGPLDLDETLAAFQATIRWWHEWIAQSTYSGRWREMVGRSALTLKLMTSVTHGAMVAAPTLGLPEQIGGGRNWDYRYCWVRDTSFAMFAFVRLGFTEEASRFVDWIGARVAEGTGGKNGNGPLRVMYALDGRADLPESTLDLAGYRDSRPVRVGNAAAEQFQLDVFGEVLDAIYLADKYGRQTSWDGWGHVCAMVTWLRDNWRRPDRGIWEGRGEEKHFLHSRLMCWVAVDRAIRLAQARSLPAPLPDWNQTRLEIHYSIHQEFWDEGLRSFVQYPGSCTVDGSMLLMPLVRFIAGDDPRWLDTLKQIEAQLVTDCLVRRRAAEDVVLDGLDGEEGAFLACSFWYVEALARAGQVARARLMFEKLLGYANHLGLYAEEISPTGEQLGNMPQVLTHLALISSAAYLSRALDGGGGHRSWM